jgi:hypothetical protein
MIWKEAIMAWWGQYPNIYIKRLRKTTINLSQYNRSRPKCTSQMQVQRIHYRFNQLAPLNKCRLSLLVHQFLNSSILRRRSQWPRGLRREMSSPARILGSWVRIPFEAWMFVYVYSVFVLGSGLATGWSPVQGVLPTVYGIKKLKWQRNVSRIPYAPEGTTGI